MPAEKQVDPLSISAGAAATRSSATYRQLNRRAWSTLARERCSSSRPFDASCFANARNILDPFGMLPWSQIKTVLCLAAAGGQQAPLFASLGCEVVSADLCSEQLDLDERVANWRGLSIDCLETDMLDLSALYGCEFDLVFQAVSACYVPDVTRLYTEVARVLRPGGTYRVEHWNPIYLQLADSAWDGQAYRLDRPFSSTPVPWYSGDNGDHAGWHYMHALGELIGSLCRTGFDIQLFNESPRDAPRSAEPGSHEHLARYLAPFYTVIGRKRSRAQMKGSPR